MNDEFEEISISDLEQTLNVDIVDNLYKTHIKVGETKVLKAYKTELGVLNKEINLQSNGQKVLGLYQSRLNENIIYFVLYRRNKEETVLTQWRDIIEGMYEK